MKNIRISAKVAFEVNEVKIGETKDFVIETTVPDEHLDDPDYYITMNLMVFEEVENFLNKVIEEGTDVQFSYEKPHPWINLLDLNYTVQDKNNEPTSPVQVRKMTEKQIGSIYQYLYYKRCREMARVK